MQPVRPDRSLGRGCRARRGSGCPQNARTGTLRRPLSTGSPLWPCPVLWLLPRVGCQPSSCPCRVPPRTPLERRREAHVSAQQPSPQSQARVPSPYADQGRSAHRPEPPQSRPGQAVGVIPAVPPHGTLRHGRDIARTLRASHQRAGRFVVLHAVTRDDVDAARLAVVASRRVGGAVTRNRAKRLLREAARHLPIRPGTDVVLVARAACARSGLTEVHDELARLAGQLDVLATEEARR